MTTRQLLVVVFVVFVGAVRGSHHRPNIIFITASNMGFNDIEWNNPEIQTPILKRMAEKHGVIIKHSYVAPTAAATRAALFTGYYGFRTGLQHSEIRSSVPLGLPTEFTLLPQVLKKHHYSTYAIGKWGLGFCNEKYLPTSRGFDYFFGAYSYAIDHYKHVRREWQTDYEGIDLHEDRPGDLKPTTSERYSTRLFGDKAVHVIKHHQTGNPFFLYLSFVAPREPLQVPIQYEKRFKETTSEKRRLFSAMVYYLDLTVGRIVEELEKQMMLKNTIFVFTSESAANFTDGGSNWPLRGGKGSVWEGGTRVPTMIASWNHSYIAKRGHVTEKMFNAVDWFPTLLGMIGLKHDPDIAELLQDMDGVDQSEMLSQDAEGPRKQMVYNIDEITDRRAIRNDRYKLLVGRPGDRNSWYPLTASDNDQALTVDDTVTRENEWEYDHLFDLQEDPGESHDLADAKPDIVNDLRKQLKDHENLLVEGHRPVIPDDFKAAANPENFDGHWMSGWC